MLRLSMIILFKKKQTFMINKGLEIRYQLCYLIVYNRQCCSCTRKKKQQIRCNTTVRTGYIYILSLIIMCDPKTNYRLNNLNKPSIFSKRKTKPHTHSSRILVLMHF